MKGKLKLTVAESFVKTYVSLVYDSQVRNTLFSWVRKKVRRLMNKTKSELKLNSISL